MQTHSLICHPLTPAKAKLAVAVEIELLTDSSHLVHFKITGEVGSVYTLVPIVPPQRKDELWRTTCFEIFAMPDGGSGYIELNFAPNFDWAAYAFNAYRERAPDPDVEELGGGFAATGTEMRFSVPLTPLAELTPCKLNLAAVIEENDGTKSYWALHHPDPEKPDFHHPDSFVLKLPA